MEMGIILAELSPLVSYSIIMPGFSRRWSTIRRYVLQTWIISSNVDRLVKRGRRGQLVVHHAPMKSHT